MAYSGKAHYNETELFACLSALRKLAGIPPYDNPANPARGDGYFAAQITRQYDSVIQELATGKVRQERQSWLGARQRFEEYLHWSLTDGQEFDAVQAMKAHGGSFARNLASAWLCADSTNQRLLRETFGSLLMTYYNQFVKGKV